MRLPLHPSIFYPAFQSHRSTPGEREKSPSYINNVAKCRRDNNDLTAVRRSAFYRRCSRSGSFVKIGSNDPDAGITLSRSPPFAPNRSGVFARLSRSIALVLFLPVFPGGLLSPGAVPSLCYRAFLTPITRFFKSTTCPHVRTAGGKYRGRPRNRHCSRKYTLLTVFELWVLLVTDDRFFVRSAKNLIKAVASTYDE